MVKRKRLLFVITHLELGGAQKELLLFIKGLNRSEYDIYLYAGNRGYLKNEFASLDYLNLHLDPFLVREINPLFDVLSFLKLFIFIKKHKFDIIHTHSPKASVLGRWAAYLAGVRNIIYTVHGWSFHSYMPSMVFNLFVLIEKLTAYITKAIIVVSRYDLYLAGKYKIMPRSRKIALVHYGIEVASYLHITSSRCDEVPFPLIITVGALKKQKGLLDFVAASEKILEVFPKSRFLIIGDGPQRKKILGKIKKSGIYNRLVLTGWLKDLRPLYKQASLFMLTSYWEGLPVSLIEAIFCGIPAVVTDTGGVKDIVQDISSVYIVKKGDVKNLAEKAIYILRNYPYFSKIAKESSLKLNSDYWSETRQQKEVESFY